MLQRAEFEISDELAESLDIRSFLLVVKQTLFLLSAAVNSTSKLKGGEGILNRLGLDLLVVLVIRGLGLRLLDISISLLGVSRSIVRDDGVEINALVEGVEVSVKEDLRKVEEALGVLRRVAGDDTRVHSEDVSDLDHHVRQERRLVLLGEWLGHCEGCQVRRIRRHNLHYHLRSSSSSKMNERTNERR